MVFGLLACVAAPLAMAQSPQPKSAPSKPLPKQEPKQPLRQQPKQQPAQPVPPAGPQLVYSSWSKFCAKDQGQPDAREVCMTIKEARLHTGQFVAGAAVIEPSGEDQKVLRTTLPLGLQIKAGTRVLIDQARAMQELYVVCFPNGCMADFEIGPDIISTMKNSQMLLLQGMNLQGQVVTFPLPLGDFAKAHEGPPAELPPPPPKQ
jgi:invasion protein IalB